MAHVKAYRIMMVDSRGPWESNPQHTFITVSGQEWLEESFAPIAKLHHTPEPQPGIEIRIQYQDARERWWDLDQDEVNELLELN